jgi:hypothetical protein
LVCQKSPPINEEEFALILGLPSSVVDESREEISKNISWRRELPPVEAREILDIVQHQAVTSFPEITLGLDGTTYELTIELGNNKVQFTWWCEPPLAWKALGEVSKILLTKADAVSMIEDLQSDTRKQLIEKLEEVFDEVQAYRKKESEESLRTHNRRCHELASSLRFTGLTCPGCGHHSRDIRFFDKSPDAKSYFICAACGRSFRPDDL